MTDLTPREREIVVLIGRDGAQYGTVANLLEISVHTVRAHVRRVAEKLATDRPPREAVVVLYHSETALAANGTTADGDF